MSETMDSRRDASGSTKVAAANAANAGGAGSGPRGGGGGAGPHHHHHHHHQMDAQQQHAPFGHQQQQHHTAFSQQQQQHQDYSSWRNSMPAVAPQDAYNNFYHYGAYSPFAANDIRDSIAAIWSRTSPSASGEGVTAAAFSGAGYGQFADTSGGQFAANSTPGGQFAANLTGHFGPSSELSMFGAGAGDYAAYGQQQYSYGPTYTQWPDNGAEGNAGRNGAYSYLSAEGRERMSDVHLAMDAMKVSSGGGKKSESNGYQSSSSGGQMQAKKMSWANVASQPAKPQSSVTKTKKPGVLPPPAIIPSSKTAVIVPGPSDLQQPGMTATSATSKTEASFHPSQGSPHSHAELPQAVPASRDMLSAGNCVPGVVPVPNSGPPTFASAGPRGGGGGGGPAPTNQGPRASRVTANGAPGVGPPLSGQAFPDKGPVVMTKAHPVLESLKEKNNYNPKTFDLAPKNARYFVIKSFSEDDIHRSIKYEIWCSTEHGNKRLEAAFKERNGKGPVYLLFSVNGSGHFCGMAQMLSGVDYNTTNCVWVQDKFKGQFKVKWIYVKDVPNGQLRHIRLENNENKPVTNSRDTQEVPPEKGKLVLKIIHSYKHQTSIFDDFVHYEKRQLEEQEGKKSGGAGGAGGVPSQHHSGGGGNGSHGSEGGRGSSGGSGGKSKPHNLARNN